MKKLSLLLGLISLILAFPAQSQIVTKYSQGFEATGETSSYTFVQGDVTIQTAVASSGSRCLKLGQTPQDAVMMLDTIDFTDNSSFQYFYLEFMHICDVDPMTCVNADDVGIVEIKLAGEPESAWTRLSQQDYDITWGGGTSNYNGNECFSNRSYAPWEGTSINNTWWKRERFKLGTHIINNTALSQRRVLIRFTLKARRSNVAQNSTGWYLDNITVKASPTSMVLPIMNIVAYPDMMEYPTSRGVRIITDITTSVTQGMDPDSMYIVYQLGGSAPVLRKSLTPVAGVSNRYDVVIPFCGYDTIVKWRIVARDFTLNHNTATFPIDESGWQQYKCVRGKENMTPMRSGTTGNTAINLFPFSNNGDAKTQMIYTQADLQAAGYEAGAITQIRYNAASNVSNSQHNRFCIRMCNLDPDYVIPSDGKFYAEYMKVVYDSALTITQNNGTVGVIDLQDTFFYAGKSIMIMMICDNTPSTGNPAALSVRSFSDVPTGTETIYTGYSATTTQYSPFTHSLYSYGTTDNNRPNFSFHSNINRPLIYDCGISGFYTPNDSTPANAVGTNNVVLTLKNYGVSTINAVRIYYRVDDSTAKYYDWTGTLAGGATTNVTVNTTQYYTPGYHTMTAWVDDTVTVSGAKFRDHEPLNDTLHTPFIGCNGPMSGVRTVGGNNPDYTSLENFLYAVSQCGVNGPLTVKLEGGYYFPQVFPSIPGVSATNYIQFEPRNATGANVTFVSAMGATSNVNSLINLQQTHHIRFKGINFWSNAASNPATYLVRMGINSTGCQFLNCTFSEVQGGSYAENYMAATALVYSGGADSLLFDGCTFSRGTAGISLIGPASDNMAHGNIVRGNSFSHQGTNGVIIRNQVAAIVDSNVFDDVYANSSYVILFQDCQGPTRATRNKVYVTSGASCLGVTNFYGTATDYAVVANNMLVSMDQGTSNMLTTALNIITADYTKVLNNAVKLYAPTRSGIAAATFGGGTLDHSYFYNNIVSCFDTVNFAFNYIPNAGLTNYIGYNIYYSRGPMLNKFNGINCLTFAQWLQHHTTDGNSQFVDPAFLNADNTDLRSYSQHVKGHGVPFAEVTTDLFGTARDSVAPCLGAFEFSTLPYDFEIIEFLQPFSEYCIAPNAAPLQVVIKNSGMNNFNHTANNLTLTYARTNVPGTMPAGVSGNILLNRDIPAGDTIIFTTSATIQFPSNGLLDTTYHFYAWLTSLIDPNPANDTSSMTVTSHYHFPAPDSLSTTINYGSQATITATGGLQTWYPNVYASGSSHKSAVYWYDSPDSDTPIYRGNTFTSGLIYHDTSFYIRQKRDYPLMKITEVQIKKNVYGYTDPQPLWMDQNTVFAIELTNVGDYPANMEGDSIVIISSQNTYNNKIYRFPNVTIQPGASLVLQYRSGINISDSTKTLGTTTLTPNANIDFAIIYKSNSVITDAVAMNNITTHARWTAMSVPNTVWTGSGIALQGLDSTAGVYRTHWPVNPNATPSNTSQFWQIADEEHRMGIGTTNTNLIRYTDNGCLGDVAPVRVHLTQLPAVDVSVDPFTLPSGCGLGIEPLSVTLHNGGSMACGQLVLHYSLNESLVCSDTIASGIVSLGSVNHTFSQSVDLTENGYAVEKRVKVWVEAVNGDNAHVNDTMSLTVISSYAPGLPNVYQYDTVQYGARAVLHAVTPPTDSLAWYDRFMNPLDTTNVFTSDYLYAYDTFYVTAFGPMVNDYHVGTMASLTTATGYPSPYNPNKKYVKEQYLYLAEDLIAAGHGAGPISSLAFYLDTILGSAGSMTFTDYTISIGTTTNTTFTANNNWQTVTPYYHASTLTMNNINKGWMTHVLDSVFLWDGHSNIVVQITRSINPAITQGARTRYTAAGSNKVLYKNDNTSDMASFTGNGSRSANRPDIQFGFVDYGCEGPALPVYIAVTGVPPSDAALEWPLNYDTLTFSSCGNIDIDAVVYNRGTAPFNSFTVDYQIDNTTGTYTGNINVPPAGYNNITFAQPALNPGRHYLRAVISLVGDSVHTNDTIERIINVRFCTGTYTIGNGGLYPSFNVAIDTLLNAGIAGAVDFSVLSGTYNEQIVLGAVPGTSPTNTVTFRSATDSAADVVVRYATANGSNYVLSLDNAQYINFENITFRSAPSGNVTYGNVIDINNSSQIHFTGDVIRVKGTINNANASCILIGDSVRALYITDCIIDSGYYSIKSKVTVPDSTNGIYISGDTIRNFWSQGIALRNVKDVYITKNYIRGGVNISGRALTGIFIAQHNGAVTIEQNNVVLYDTRDGAKRGLHLVNVRASNAIRSKVYNNMFAIHGTGGGSNNFRTTGIFIDSCENINVYFNTANVFSGTNSNARNSSAFWIQTTSSGAHVMNNCFSNFSGGFAYWIQNAANLGTSNYNNYYSNDGERFYHVGVNEGNGMAGLRQRTGKDANSRFEQPYYVSDEDIHYSIGTLCEKAQYLTDVPLDMDDTQRPQIPSPTIGAHEFIRNNHDIAIMEILEPRLGVTDNVESDSLRIVVKLTNGGNSTESNLVWWAEIIGTNPLLRTVNRNIMEMQPQDVVYDTAYIPMPIGIIDTQILVVHFPMATDAAPFNNIDTAIFFLDPAYNFQAVEVAAITGTGCRLQNTQVTIKLRNVGRKEFPANAPVNVGFSAWLAPNENVTVATLPLQWVETVTLPTAVPLLADVVLTYNQTANLYPTGIAKDISIKCRGWATYQHDQKPLNDTTGVITVQSKYTPSSPVADDLHIPYASWDTIFASQTDVTPTGSVLHRNIRWYRDSTANSFFHPNNYNNSCWWETPQYFHDSVYYLCCVSQAGCTSYYSQVHVILNSRVGVDAAINAVVEPQPFMVYMYDDSVKVSIVNHGTQAISNIPVVYQLYDINSQTVLQEVHETCPATIQPDDAYVYKFDSLIHIPTWNSYQPYGIRSWTDLPNDAVHSNDTLRGAQRSNDSLSHYNTSNKYFFYALTEMAQNNGIIGLGYNSPRATNNGGFDIIRVAYSSLNNVINPVGYSYLNFASIENPEVEPLRLIKGTTDTLIIECANSDNYNDKSTMGVVTVYIDDNRDSRFEFGSGYTHDIDPNSEIYFTDTIVSRNPKNFILTIPDDIRLGYTRMRIVVEQGSLNPTQCNNDSIQFGQIHDYLLYIEDVPEQIDVSASRIVAPLPYTLEEEMNQVTFMMSNKGSTEVTSATINYEYYNEFTQDSTSTGSLQWTGSLLPGHSVEVALPERAFELGTTDLRITVSVAGDTNSSNDTLWYQYHRFHTFRLVYEDDFENVNYWYAPRGYNDYGKNLWQRGVSHKPNIVASVSDSNIWATNLSGMVNCGSKGNISYLYSPIFDISLIRPDSIMLWIASDMAENHALTMEYLNYLGEWIKVGDANDTMWYNGSAGWEGVSSGYGYEQYKFKTGPISGEFQQKLQFRLVYRALVDALPCDGCAVDNAFFGKAPRNVDAGVTEITYPINPKFGQTIYPRVKIKNFGLDTLYDVQVAYRPYGVHLARIGDFHSDQGVAPGEVTIYTFATPFVVRNDFPDTFQIVAFTVNNLDIYKENDTTIKDFYLSPLDNDVALTEFVYPLDRVIAGDSLQVTTRIRNYGQAPVSAVDVTFIYNNAYTVTERVDFNTLMGRDLNSFEYFNYTFNQKVRASMGMMTMTAFVSMDNDDYIYNDTITKRIDGISAITDLRAKEIIVDTSLHEHVRIMLAVENVGARGANDFEMGFWYYNDTNTLVRATYHAERPLPALSTLYYTFDTLLLPHAQYYRYVTAFVHIDGDNDPTNDTTTSIGQQYVELLPVRLLVQENRYDTCSVRMEVRNIGNIPNSRIFKLKATINGTEIYNNNVNRVVPPGQVITLNFNKVIPKSPTRTYVGVGRLTNSDDTDTSNNQTNVIDVQNYFEGIPVVSEASGMVLEQNFPNPFESATRIDFYIPSAGDVRFFIIDELGRLVYQSVESYNEGSNSIELNNLQISTGVYYYGIEMNGERLMKKMVYKR